jgi:hypothetical protein
MKRFSNLLYAKSSFALAIVSTVLTFSYLFLILMETARGFQIGEEFESLALSYGLTFEAVQAFFGARSGEMIESFKAFNLIWDNVFALLYGFMYAIWLSLVYKPFAQKVKLLNLLPFMQMLFDWLENSAMVVFSNTVQQGEQISETQVQIASFFSMGKWTCSGLVFLLLFIGVVWRMVQRVKE